MDEARISTAAEMIAGFAWGSENPRRRAAEMIDVLSADPRWGPDDIAAIRSRVEERLASEKPPGGILLVT
jgi:hypothetical protein